MKDSLIFIITGMAFWIPWFMVCYPAKKIF